MRLRLSLLYIAIFIFLVPNSQAVTSINGHNYYGFIGYVCELGHQSNHIRIDYSQTDTGLPCEVNMVTNGGDPKFLLSANRHILSCAVKAENMSLRLEDRGWMCQSTNH